jgi:hypothetical protein
MSADPNRLDAMIGQWRVDPPGSDDYKGLREPLEVVQGLMEHYFTANKLDALLVNPIVDNFNGTQTYPLFTALAWPAGLSPI